MRVLDFYLIGSLENTTKSLEKKRSNLSKDLFSFFGLHLILGKKTVFEEEEESHKVNFGQRKFWNSKSGGT